MKEQQKSTNTTQINSNSKLQKLTEGELEMVAGGVLGDLPKWELDEFKFDFGFEFVFKPAD